MAMRGPRLQVGSAAWVAEERSSALQIVDSEIEEFSFSARNEMDWLNEHMAAIFDENENNIAETFKTPGKLRGKTPRTARKVAPQDARIPLSDVFSSPNALSSQFSQHLNRAKSPQVRRDDFIKDATKAVQSPSQLRNVMSPKGAASQNFTQDSGYGSQNVAASFGDILHDTIADSQSSHLNFAPLPTKTTVPIKTSPTRNPNFESPEKTWQTAKEDQTTRVVPEVFSDAVETVDIEAESPHAHPSSPPATIIDPATKKDATKNVTIHEPEADDDMVDEEPSPSEASSPVRPMVRKSSINFASLPAREPLAGGKSNGSRVSRVSHLDHGRKSYYDRTTPGKSFGNFGVHHDDVDFDDEDKPAVPPKAAAVESPKKPEDLAANHNRTYTQRLQDQISMLGKAQSHGERESKSASNGNALRKPLNATTPAPQIPKSPSPMPMSAMKSTPGAFPEDDEDWIERSPAPAPVSQTLASPRPNLPKSHSADIMEGIHVAATAAPSEDIPISPDRQTIHNPPVPSSHRKSASASAAIESPEWQRNPLTLQKSVTTTDLPLSGRPASVLTGTPSKSPSRSYRESPLKHAKNKLSSIIKSSKGLFASSAAISAEGKSSILSPSTARLGFFAAPSMESLAESVRPATHKKDEARPVSRLASPTRPVAKRTRASTERERDEKQREKETKRQEEQNAKLEKARAKEREKTRTASKETLREKPQAKAAEADVDMIDEPAPAHAHASVPVQQTPMPTRKSPRRKPAEETQTGDADVEMTEPPSSALPQPSSRSIGPPSAMPKREIKRPVRPVKEALTKTKQAPTVIKVNTGSQHSQYHVPVGTSTSAVDHDQSVAQLQTQTAGKVSKPSLQSKPSTQSLRGAASAPRPKVLDSATKKREQDERDAQRRREAKAEMDRKRAVAQEEQRKADQLKRQEAERQKQKEREQSAQAEAKKQAQRQAAIEKAKQTRAPPPAVRSHLNSSQGHDSQDGSRPPSRLTSTTNMLAPGAKATAKRTLPAQGGNDASRAGPSRAGPSYQSQDAKRRRTGEDMEQSPPNIKGPPVRPSAGFKKDSMAKPAYASNYSNVPQSANRDLFKATVTSQHHSQTKPAHPLDMAQISKGAIPFAPQGAGHPTKTPVRTTAMNGMKSSVIKSTAKASPKFQNGESIELPEIQTDDEDEDSEDEGGAKGMIADWADSPDLRRALLRQETLDPSQIFGPPVALNMEEVFYKSKEKFHKFRSRTSSANWSGADRLTEDDIRKDMAARDKLRREGGWTYEMSKNLL